MKTVDVTYENIGNGAANQLVEHEMAKVMDKEIQIINRRGAIPLDQRRQGPYQAGRKARARSRDNRGAQWLKTKH